MTAAEARERPRSFNPVAFLLKAGAVAGAIGSMTGLFFTFAPWLQPGAKADPSTVTARIPGTDKDATLTVPPGAVRHLTFGQNLRELGVPVKYTKDDPSRKGVVVRYRLRFPGEPKGTHFRVRYDLYRGDALVTHLTQPITMDADSDECACRSPFIALAEKDAVYKIVVSAFRPKAPYSEPVVQKATAPFSATA